MMSAHLLSDVAAKLARRIDALTARPEATIAAIMLVLVYVAIGVHIQWTSEWLSFGGVLTGVPPFVMVFALQHSQRELVAAQIANTEAIQLKLDIINVALGHAADSRVIGAEKTPELLEALRTEICGDADPHA